MAGLFGALLLTAAAGVASAPANAQDDFLEGPEVDFVTDPALATVSSELPLNGATAEEWEAIAENALDVDLWFLEDDDITWRREAMDANRNFQVEQERQSEERRERAAAAADRTRERLDDALAARNALEVQVEKFAIQMFILSDEGLADRLGGDLIAARNTQPIRDAADAVEANITTSDIALVRARELHSVNEARLAEAEKELAGFRAFRNRAFQLDRDLEALIDRRNEAIAERTEFVLVAERPDVELVRIVSVIVRRPIPQPESEDGSDGDAPADGEVAGPNIDESAGDPTTDAPVVGEVPPAGPVITDPTPVVPSTDGDPAPDPEPSADEPTAGDPATGDDSPNEPAPTDTPTDVDIPPEPATPDFVPTPNPLGPDLPDEDGDGIPDVPFTEELIEIQPMIVNAEIAEQVAQLIGDAQSAGIELRGWGYRPRELQIELRVGHCGTSGYAIFDRRAALCSPPTARPGASQHELGLAIDFTQGGSILNSSSSGFQWLRANAANYGLRNLPSEAWHWSTTGR